MSSRDRARAHLKHAHHCTCGKVVHGNGAKWQHVEMHRRRGDGHHGITQEAYAALIEKSASDQDAPCTHPERNGRHEWYLLADRSFLCRACGARAPREAKP